MQVFLSIAEVASRTGLTAHTLRYYEKEGLVAPVARASGGQRRYAAADLDWIAFLMRLRSTGMPIQGMKDFARLRSQGQASVGARRAMLEQHLAGVLEQITALQQSARILRDKIDHYRHLEAPSHEPIHPDTL